MGGFFGDDFDVTTPEDASPVKFGASFLRDIKARLKRFLAVMFNLETGQMRNNVVTSDMLTDLVTAGTYTEVTVNTKGLVTKGTTATTQQSAAPFKAVFTYSGSPTAQIDTTTGATTLNGSSPSSAYGGGSSAPYQNTYASLDGSNYVTYTWTFPADVRRIKATIVGGGGGKQSGGSNSGGGGQMIITTFNVEDSSINSVSVIVGAGGAEGQNGGVSSVKAGNAYAEAGGGAKGDANGHGAAVAGNTNGVLTTINCPGSPGAASTGGATGSYLKKYGTGAPLQANDTNGDDGIVILEWLQ